MDSEKFVSVHSNNNEELSGIPKQNSFQVPDGYFDDLPHIITKKCLDAEKVPMRKANLLIPKYYLPVLTVIIAVLLFVFNVYDSKDSSEILKNNVQLAATSNEYSYLEDLIDNYQVEETELIDELINDDTSVNKTIYNKKDVYSMNVSIVNLSDTVQLTHDDIIQYLIEENNETDDLFNP